MKRIFIIIIAILLPLLASATYINGINYDLDSSTKTATVIQGSYSDNINIYSQVTYSGVTYTVTSIGKDAFSNSDITSVTIPSTVTFINKRAFGGCTKLTSVSIPNSVTEIAAAAFYGSTALKNIVLPSGLKEIDENLFWGCTSLTSVTIPAGVTSIGEEAFRECLALPSIIIPYSVTEIGERAFDDCTSLKGVISEIQKPYAISGNVFTGISSYATLTVPIGSKAAYEALAGWNVFQSINEPSLVDETFEADTQILIAKKDWSGVTDDVLPWIQFADDDASGYNGSVDGIEITVTQETGTLLQPQAKVLEGFALSYRGNYRVVITAKFPCNGRLQINMGNTSTSYNHDIPVTATGDFQKIVCDFPERYFGSYSDTDAYVIFQCGDFKGTTIVKKVEVFDIPHYPDKTLYGYNSEDKTASVWDEYEQCRGRVIIPATIIHDGETYTVTRIGSFEDNSFITSIFIPNSVTNIRNQAFAYCDCLISVTIGKGVTSIGDNAFSGCSALKTIVSKIEKPFIIDNSVFWGIASNVKLIVPKGTKSAYQATAGWNHFTNIVEVGDVGYEFEVDGFRYVIGENNTVSVTSGIIKNSGDVIIPEKVNYNGVSYTVTEIGEGAFSGCSGLTSITIPNSVTSIRMYAFAYCSSLTSITIPNNVPTIWFSTFYNCSSLTSVTIGNGVEVIAEGSFEGCDNLKSVIIGTNVTFIAGNTLTQKSLKYICFTSEKIPTNFDVTTTCQYIMPQTAFDGGIPQRLTNYVTYSVAPKYIKVKSTTATTATLELTPIDISGGNSESTTSYEVTMYNLKPGSSVVGSWEWDGKDCGIASIPTAMTKNLVMNVQAAQAMSTTKARLSATVNEADDDKHYGFEWLRYDAPENMTPYKVSAPLYNGEIVGTLSGLNPDIYYKYRPFYKADDGTVFVGAWEAFLTGDANVTFAPEVHTKEPVALSDGKMILLLFCAEGTEEILEKGFEIIKKAIESFGTRADGGDITKVIVSGNEMSATIEGLEPGTEYICRSYVKTASGTTYGEEKIFKTPLPGDANNDGVVNVADIVEITNAKAGNPSASFILNNADMDGNGNLTEADINAIANKIMQK